MRNMPNFTASVVLYNTPEHQLKHLLDCIEKSSIRPTVYLIDNSPVPLNFPCFDLPWVVNIKACTNGGYGAGHNIALRQTIDHAEFHFVLNPDVYFGPHELEKMVSFMGYHSDIGQLMPRVSYPDGSPQYLCKLLPTPVDLLIRRFAGGPFRQLVRKRLEYFELRFTDYSQVMDVPFLSGCFMLFRTAALRVVGLFDERFFIYAEDIDITRRVHAQFRTVFYPGATIVHDHARQSYKDKRALWIHVQNLVRYFSKWGWIWDTERTMINRDTLRQFSKLQTGLHPVANTIEDERINGNFIETRSNNLNVATDRREQKVVDDTKNEAD
jgi:GT2 family glycosyltransferase